MAKKKVKPNQIERKKQEMGRLVAILSYIPIIGWIIALVIHVNHKTSLGGFHLRNALILHLAWALFNWAPMIGAFIALLIAFIWIVGIIYAVNGKEKRLPIIGSFAQDLLKGL